MNPWIACPAMFAGAYTLTIFYTSILYHRGLAHGSVRLSPWSRRMVIATGSWVTGIDPKAWACMHRLHHRHSDLVNDPHSPVHQGVLGVMRGQLRSYKRTLVGLQAGAARYCDLVKDLDFPVNWVNRSMRWWLPYAMHALIAALFAIASHSVWFGAAYWAGMMSHPLQGWMVNALAHSYGYRNFDTPDQSRNNTLVAWLAMGEGYQNNHHSAPTDPNFSNRWFEVDGGYLLCLVAQATGALTVGPHSTYSTTNR